MARRTALISSAAAAALAFAAAPVAAQDAPAPRTERGPEDEIIYFVLPDRFENGDPSNDRGGIEGERSDHGFDPTHKAYYQGGDLKGLTQRLDYIQGLGATAIWLTPIFRNLPVQDAGGEWESAGYHGYWVTDFLDVDPHLGTREDFAAFVDAAHARGMKVYMDTITNHTADVIWYRECDDAPCDYRAKADFPTTTRGGPDGEPINDGYLGDDPQHLTRENMNRVTEFDYAYTPYVIDELKDVKNPAWLNDFRYYTHRGNNTWEGESVTYGDFAGLDDINTQHPDVVEGFIDVYQQWITDFGVDGFRVDTVKHVRPEFWREWSPAIMTHAEELGVGHFHLFGEVYEFDIAKLSAWVTDADIPSVLDFPLQGATQAWITGQGSARGIAEVFQADTAYGGADAVRIMPTFLGNHDMGRIGGFLHEALPDADEEELFARTRLAHALMMFSRGVPVIYYGDEQGFVSDGNDQDARETMFPSRTAVYNDNDIIGSDASPADENFDTTHPLYQAIAEMAAVRQAHSALRGGALRVRYSDEDGGLIAFSRRDAETGAEILGVFNAGTEARSLNVLVDGASTAWTSLIGACAEAAAAPTSYAVDVPALDFVLCKSSR